MASSSSYPCPSSLNIGNFVSFKLTHTNFLLWKTHILALIESQDLQGFINGENSTPESFIRSLGTDAKEEKEVQNPKYIEWKRFDRLLKGWLTATL